MENGKKIWKIGQKLKIGQKIEKLTKWKMEKKIENGVKKLD